MPMEMHYEYSEDGSMENISFKGLNGNEFAGNLKSALELLKIENPAITFNNRVKAGEFDDMEDDEYSMILHAVDSLSSLWHYPDDGETKNREMNVLMLLANAIEVISKQNVTISILRVDREMRAMQMK